MAERKTGVRRIDSAAVQGEGSFVTLRALTVGEFRALMRAGEKDDAQDVEDSLEMIRSHVVAWDWVDDEGKPLPLPSEDPEAVHKLTSAELHFLGKAFNAMGTSAADLKA